MEQQSKQTKKLPGFYIALCCCVIAIGLAGFFSQKMQSKSQNNTAVSEAVTSEDAVNENYQEAFNTSAEMISEEEPYEVPVITEPEPEPEEPVMEEYAIDNPDIQVAAITVNAEEGGLFLDPVPVGAILAGFSADKLEYNEFYSDWRAHNGIDIAADTGCSVSAISDGTVLETGSASMGGYVIIDHGNGFTATYAQLGDINVKEGETVSSGSVIGTVANPVAENTKEPHLHFELTKNGTPVNPEEY
ncbi:MAG: M23 family metallopeptidase [Oscillospiraceae bacterium]|nr:M23 family metallopeptidase [Oscillospiraceae bacterium]